MRWGRERRVPWLWLWSQPTWDPMTHCWTHWTKFRFQKGCFSAPTVFNYWSADKEGMTCLRSLSHLRFHVIQGENYLLELPTSPAAKETPSWCLHQVGMHSSISWPANLVHLSPCNTNLTPCLSGRHQQSPSTPIIFHLRRELPSHQSGGERAWGPDWWSIWKSFLKEKLYAASESVIISWIIILLVPPSSLK